MIALLSLIYGSFYFLFFKKLKLFAESVRNIAIFAGIGVTMIGAIVYAWWTFAPTTADGRVFRYVIPIVPNVSGQVIEVPIEGYLESAVKASSGAAGLALIQYRQGAVDYTRVLNTQTALLQQQDALTSARGQVVSNLVATYKALGGGWQLREGNRYIGQDMVDTMEQRTDWGEILTAPENP